jgi:hypothetical protein
MTRCHLKLPFPCDEINAQIVLNFIIIFKKKNKEKKKKRKSEKRELPLEGI